MHSEKIVQGGSSVRLYDSNLTLFQMIEPSISPPEQGSVIYLSCLAIIMINVVFLFFSTNLTCNTVRLCVWAGILLQVRTWRNTGPTDREVVSRCTCVRSPVREVKLGLLAQSIGEGRTVLLRRQERTTSY